MLWFDVRTCCDAEWRVAGTKSSFIDTICNIHAFSPTHSPLSWERNFRPESTTPATVEQADLLMDSGGTWFDPYSLRRDSPSGVPPASAPTTIATNYRLTEQHWFTSGLEGFIRFKDLPPEEQLTRGTSVVPTPLLWGSQPHAEHPHNHLVMTASVAMAGDATREFLEWSVHHARFPLCGVHLRCDGCEAMASYRFCPHLSSPFFTFSNTVIPSSSPLYDLQSFP